MLSKRNRTIVQLPLKTYRTPTTTLISRFLFLAILHPARKRHYLVQRPSERTLLVSSLSGLPAFAQKPKDFMLCFLDLFLCGFLPGISVLVIVYAVGFSGVSCVWCNWG